MNWKSLLVGMQTVEMKKSADTVWLDQGLCSKKGLQQMQTNWKDLASPLFGYLMTYRIVQSVCKAMQFNYLWLYLHRDHQQPTYIWYGNYAQPLVP